MCVLAVRIDPEYGLTVAANRDELRGRPSTPPQILEPGIIGGKDLQSGGTWLGLNDRGLFVAVTNRKTPPRGASRGLVALEALRCSTLADVEQSVRSRLASVGGFNLVAVLGSEGVCLHYDGTLRPSPLSRGIHVVSSDRDADDPSMSEIHGWTAWDLDSLRKLVARHDGDRPICKHGERFGTVSSTLYLAQERILWHADGNPCSATFRDYSGLI